MRGFLKDFKLVKGLQFDLLQFADDTIILCKPSSSNLQFIKELLRGFELISGLNINLCKSCLMSVNVEDNFLMEAASCLCYETGPIPLNFLGIPIVVIQRRLDVWYPIIIKMKQRLSSWKREFFPIGGRITLINSRVLVGDGLDRKGIAWVKWSEWKWRFLVDKDAAWRQLLQYRYGSLEDVVLGGVSKVSVKKSSNWWRDVVSYTVDVDFSDWFLRGIECRLGSGKLVKFWHNNWYVGNPFKELFPVAFCKTVNSDGFVVDMGVLVDDRWFGARGCICCQH
ncbi:uncharacterized protein LOC131659929 [Vicia villosa]|uniref:uncharacterized protein LOC131659929 n=1 Tax=Vicia villosa TaxID=3911 RepID=UPI00273B2A84|nr:uncharacterized protein LOC131659929 [Vicia villosa]